MKVYRTVLLGLLAGGTVALAAAPANADGGPGRRASYAAPCCSFFNGFYLGGHAGYTFKSDVFVRDVDGYNGPLGSFGYDANGPMAGIQLGYNLKLQNFLAGVEVDLGGMKISDNAQFPPYVGVRGPLDSRASFSTDAYATVTGRLGFLLGDSVLLYGKAGWGTVHASVSFIDQDPAGITLTTGTGSRAWLDGAVWGGGIEVAIGKYASVKLEYLRFDVGETITHRATSTGAPAFPRFAHTIDDIDTVKIGFNFKLDRCCEAAPLK